MLRHCRAAIVSLAVLTLITGSEFFPGGLGEFVVRQNGFLQFEAGRMQ